MINKILLILVAAVALIGCGEKGPSGQESVTNEIVDAKKSGGGSEGNGVQIPDGGASDLGSRSGSTPANAGSGK